MLVMDLINQIVDTEQKGNKPKAVVMGTISRQMISSELEARFTGFSHTGLVTKFYNLDVIVNDQLGESFVGVIV